MRTQRSIYNFLTSYIPYLILVMLGFVKIRLFISHLGEDIYSLNQLYTNVFSYLTVAEAGVGLAFIYRLYKLLANKDYDAINAIYSGTKVLLNKTGIIVLIAGVVLSFGISLLIKNNPFSNLYVQATFMLFVIRNAIDYFMSVPRFIAQADQRAYKINILFNSFRIIEVIIEIILLLLGVNYLIILIPDIFIRIIQNIYVNRKVFKLYPWLKKVEEKDDSPKEDIKHMLVHRVVGLVSNNIDIVILSAFIGSKVVAIYATYQYLTKYALETASQIFSSMKDGLGNVLHTENKQKIKEVIDEFFVIFSFIGSIVAIVFYFILDDFVKIWVGKEYIISHNGLILFLIILFYSITIRSITIIRTTMGLFKETKIMAAVEAGINLVLSLMLVHSMGIVGVLLATVIAFMLTNFWYYPHVIYSKLFDKNIVEYMIKIFPNVIIILMMVYIGNYLYPVISDVALTNSQLANWFISSLIFGSIIIIFVSIIYVISYPEFRRIILRGLRVLKGIIQKKKHQ